MKSEPLNPSSQAPNGEPERFHPLSVGLRAARANFVPGLIVQAAMVALVLAYYCYEPARLWLAHLAEAKRAGGYLFSLFAGAVAGGVLPELLAVGIFQKWEVRRENFANLAFNMVFWGINAMIVDAFYRAQAWGFGAQVDFPTVCKKVLVDQFVYNPVFAAPFGLTAYEWRNHGYRLASLRPVATARFYKEKTFPTLLATWGVWIPVVSLVYSLPPLLQIPLFSLALTFWVMLFTWINRR